MEDKKTTIRFSDDEAKKIESIKKILDASTTNGAIKYIINNFLLITTELKLKNQELIMVKNEKKLLESKIENFNLALKNLKM